MSYVMLYIILGNYTQPFQRMSGMLSFRPWDVAQDHTVFPYANRVAFNSVRSKSSLKSLTLFVNICAGNKAHLNKGDFAEWQNDV